MPKMTFKLKAENSSGRQDLIVETNGNGEVYITLLGQYRGEPIQIDFDTLDRQNFKEQLQILVEQL